jgi:arylsulfatase A-like enzyme
MVNKDDKLDELTDNYRGKIPIPDKPYMGTILYDAKDPESKFPPIEQIHPPKEAPNILLILLDDVGFGASSAFGGPINTPTAEKMAANGLKYTRFHTTALCAPTRACMLTGRNHHTVGMGSVTELASAAPGYNSMRPNTCAPLAKILKLNGYSTAQFGKCHEVPIWENSPLGPFDHWPAVGGGFERFYGFQAGETNQWFPELIDNTNRVELPEDPDYHLMPDMTEKCINYMKMQKAIAPDKPFFVYFAPGATHAPHHVPKEWADKYKGQFDDGWDKLRQNIFTRQKELGVIPPESKLTKRHDEIPAWEDMPEDLKPVLRRQMEVYAGFLEYTDYHIGKIIDTLEKGKLLDDTLVIYIIGDNGASAEGTLNGAFNEMANFNGLASIETPEYLLSKLDELGGPNSYNHYSVGWAHAMCTPYQWTKQVASHFGGTRNGTIVHWPNHIKDKGSLRHQFHHVVDIAPTILELAGIPEPNEVDGVGQYPMEGISFAYTLNDSNTPDRKDIQYFECMGNRGIYYKGWTAVTKHRTPWELMAKPVAFDDDKWELYDTTNDWTQAEDLSKKYPDKLHELQRLWLIEATRHNVLPLDDRAAERFIAELAGRPELIKGNSQVIFPGMVLGEGHTINIKNRSHSITAEVEIEKTGVKGVIVAQGADFGGWALYAHEGKLKYVYNLIGIQFYEVEAPETLPVGNYQVRMEFKYDGGGLGQGGDVKLYVDGKQVAEGRVDHTQAIVFAADSTLMVGDKTGAPISKDFNKSRNEFTGKVNWVNIDVGEDSQDHLIDPTEWIRIHMSIQ